MENKTSANKSRVLVSKILIEPDISNIMSEIYFKIPDVFYHSIDVAYLAGEVAYELDLTYTDDIIRGALLHDIGKLRIPKDLLETTRHLTPEDREILKTHSIRGYDIVKTNWKFSDVVLDIVKYHHEKQDGSGYPESLKASELKKAVKIVTVCDIYDALTKDKPYRKAYGVYEALDIMQNEPVDRSIFKILKDCPDH